MWFERTNERTSERFELAALVKASEFIWFARLMFDLSCSSSSKSKRSAGKTSRKQFNASAAAAAGQQ